ncbi:HNH endonuclease [Butyrivibrio sp. INlla14]|uniref:HNH endonuclease n=1 Tax=Butyrivibrio sp. INlla14 TaxID=1520808 RepID=UPI0008770EE3|nr:HNH endonuclease [Butyrivibrio sp. INlla14]SCY77258.1 TIGR02646 family protein [Butyrivibrio sp. INlla14]
MIKLSRIDAPIELSDDIVKKLTEEYKLDNKKAVWRKPYITGSLLKMSHCKCSYCETKLGEEGKYMEVDHYHPKNKYPDEVVMWDNLIPSCGRCNSNKSTCDTYLEPIINPYVDNPKEYLYMENYRIKSRNNNKLGRKTIDVLYLNDMEGLILPRFKIGNAVQEKLGSILDVFDEYKRNPNFSRRNKIVNATKELLKEAREDSEYASLVATVLLQDDNYILLKERLKSANLWDDELKTLDKNAIKIALIK